MKIKDIVNRDVVNLQNCEHEPIHIPGSIQPHGFLLSIKKADFIIDYCSGNTVEFIGAAYQQLLGKTFSEAFGQESKITLENYINKSAQNFSAPLLIVLARNKFSCSVQQYGLTYILEFEKPSDEELAVEDIYEQTRQFTNYMLQVNSLKGLCQLVADETRAITGYDRVMIYRFDEDYNGEVFAESKIDSIETFLGLHYPHTDIPVQARQLYIKNHIRLIVDVNYTPVPIYTVDDMPGKNLDLGLSNLRSVSPIHIQYLQNMGVGATLTISLLHEGRLWGLIACHHYSPKYITNDVRIAAQLQGHFLTSQISVRQLNEEYEIAKAVNTHMDALLVKLASSNDISLEEIISQPELRLATHAASVIILVNGQIYSQGKVPPRQEIIRLAHWLSGYNSHTGFNSSNLSKQYEPANQWCDAAAGIIYHALGSGADNCIIWCRPEALQEVNWAGNPEKAIVKDAKGLSPRKSFELWKEVKQCESTPWKKPELLAAANVANGLQKHVHTMFLSREELKHRKLSEKLKEANAELENINWIGSHDLKEPLRKIQVFASRILSEEEGNEQLARNYVAKMNESARRMQVLITDMLDYSRLNHNEEGFKEVNLNTVVGNVVDQLNFEIAEKQANVYYTNLPTVMGVPFFLQQLFVNLVSNALKFSKETEQPEIHIFSEEVEFRGAAEEKLSGKHFKVSLQDNGIGFDEKFKDTIFKVFKKLHNTSDYGGTGIGLALCKKIMQTHNGSIDVASKPGKGTTFYLYFPKPGRSE